MEEANISFSAFFSTTAALSLVGSTVTVNAQIYQSATPDNVFSPIAGTLISLTPSLTGIHAFVRFSRFFSMRIMEWRSFSRHGDKTKVSPDTENNNRIV